jgi:molybdate transport system substrate-binding protein
LKKWEPDHPVAKRRKNRTAGIFLLAALVSPAAGVSADAVTVSAAVSLRDALNEIWQPTGADERPEVVLNAAGSGTLLRQILQGAPVDLFISASPVELDELEQAGLLVPGSRKIVASNRLVTIFSLERHPPARFRDLSAHGLMRIAIGNPRTVPAGRYAREALESTGLWEPLQDRLVFAENVRQVVEYVARGDVDAGLVYRTDAALFGGRIITGPEPPVESYSQIQYQAAVLKESTVKEAASELLELLQAPFGRQRLHRYGFTVPADTQ